MTGAGERPTALARAVVVSAAMLGFALLAAAGAWADQSATNAAGAAHIPVSVSAYPWLIVGALITLVFLVAGLIVTRPR